MVLSPQLATGRAVGQFFEAPGKPLHGTVTFTASISHASAPAAEPNPFTVLPRPQQGVIDSQGFLCTTGPDALAGERGVVLVAVDNPELSTVGWHWVASIRQTDEEGNWLATLPSFPVHVLTGEEVDLSRSMRLPVGEVISVDQAKALADAAERHSSAAREEAVAARKDATRAAGAAVDAAGDAATAGAAAAQSRDAALAAEAFTGRASDSAAAAEASAGAAEVSAGAAREQATTAAGAAQAAVREAAQAKTVAGESRDAAAAAAGSAAQAADAAASSATDADSSAVNARQALERAENAASSADRATEVVRRADAGEFVPNISIGEVITLPNPGDDVWMADILRRGTASQAAIRETMPSTFKGDKGDAGGWTAGEYVADRHLDTVTTPGLYKQSTAMYINTDYGCPAGISSPTGRYALHVYNWGATGAIVQELVTIGSITFPSLTYRRRLENGQPVTPWTVTTPQRVDNTAGRTIYTWDDTARREQLIYGDTGSRIITDDLIDTTKWNVTIAKLRRTMHTVELRFQASIVAGNTGTVQVFRPDAKLPIGFRNQHTVPLLATNGSNIRTGNLSYAGGPMSINDMAAGVGAIVIAQWTTYDPWPTTLPGSPDGAIATS